MGATMTRSEVRIARIIFYLAAVVSVIYGMLFLSVPEWQFELSQDPGAPGNPGWVRWSGASLIGMALAALLAADQPDRQRPLVVGLGFAYLLVALALLYSIVAGEYRGVQWFVWLPIVINLSIFAAIVWLLIKTAPRLRL
jgi:hypothetical protein